MATDSSKICHRRCFMSMVSKTLYSDLSGQGSYYATHTLGQKFTNCLWCLWCHYSWPLPEASSTTVCDLTAPPHCLWAACTCLSLSAVVFSRSIGVEFVHWTWICFSTCANLNIRSFNLNFRYMATSKQASKQTYTHTCNAVTLVWGSLRLAPIIRGYAPLP